MADLVSIEKELQKSYLEYSLSVIVGRAIPDVRDGLKPVHRRILFAMHDLGNYYNRQYKKSARVVGDVIGKYHPHGDSAVYDALVRMAQGFNMREPLVDGQGNFGSIDGDAAAAMRYTEARMARITSFFLNDIDKKTVDFRPNYDNTMEEPVVLPARIPNLLINGSSGIAVGMATNIPPHNLGEVIDATLHLLENSEASISDLMGFIKAPDFPTGAFIYNHAGIREAYKTGRGSVMIRSKIEVETRKSGLESLVVSEIPYAVNKSNLVEKIALLVNDQKIEGISDLRDESDRNGIRIVIDLKKNVFADVVTNQLYKFTQLQTSFGINMMAVVNGRPMLLNLKNVLEYFIDFRKEVVIRRSQYELQKAEERAHILEGLRIALDHIDEVVALIRASSTPPEAKEGLISRFDLSAVQAQAILDMRLQRLTNLEREKIVEEYRELLKKIEYLKSIIENSDVLRSVIREELKEVREKFISPRRSVILDHDPDAINLEDVIPDDDVVITLSHNGYIKRVSLDNYQQQKKGGKGIAGVNLSDNDFVNTMLTTTNHQNFYMFTSKGRLFATKVYQVPEGSRTAKGAHIANMLSLEDGEVVSAVLTGREIDNDKYLLFITKMGQVKRSSLALYSKIRKNGLIAVNLRDGDELIAVRMVDDDDDVIIITCNGLAIRFKCSDIRSTGRGTSGVRGVRLSNGDSVVTGVIYRSGGNSELLTIAENGLGKRTSVDHYRGQGRGGKGVINMRITPKTGQVVGGLMVSSDDEIIILTSGNKIIRIGIREISLVGRATQGVRLVRLDDDQKVVCFARVIPESVPAE